MTAIADAGFRLDDQVGYILRRVSQRHGAIFQFPGTGRIDSHAIRSPGADGGSGAGFAKSTWPDDRHGCRDDQGCGVAA